MFVIKDALYSLFYSSRPSILILPRGVQHVLIQVSVLARVYIVMRSLQTKLSHRDYDFICTRPCIVCACMCAAQVCCAHVSSF